MRNKIILGSIAIIIIGVSLYLLNPSKDNEELTTEGSTEAEVETMAEVDGEAKAAAEALNEEEAKELVASQFEYFQAIVNGSYFKNARKNGPQDNYSDSWVSETIKEELHQRAVEIDELLPEQASDSISQDLLQVLIQINQASSPFESQKNIYRVYKTLLELHIILNDYTLEEGMFDPKEDWDQVFNQTEEEEEIKSEAELQAELDKAAAAGADVEVETNEE
ncbi:hypothetical protein AB3Z07_03285 [Metabacillus halosaccharovorans]|uniref:hypothetical protein n=1 Tax=Metabacillus halosaccharovorans TaxID=930124 RepID=UPI00204070C7|nr:hypothetical protein [Metabacillus halosaccharovorans]MCM3444120.1 hypothetical protein [Metabacillus halosaccharovorans]